jgi:hypothetical protein
VAREVFSLPTGNDTLTHAFKAFAASQADCDDAHPGSVYADGACEATFLRHAVEMPGFTTGNGNLLCESGETCLFTPNIGGYQGHGPLISAGVFEVGTLTGIQLLRFTSNGR